MDFKKMFSVLLILAVMFSPSIGFAATGDSNLTNLVASGNVTIQSTLITAGRINATTTLQSSSTNLKTASIAYAVILKRIGNGADSAGEGGELRNGTPGQILSLIGIYREASGTFKITPATKTGFTSVSLGAIGTYVTFLYVDDTIGWIILGTNATVV